MATIKITLKRSLIGRGEKQVLTAKSLGLKKVNDVTVQPNNPQTLGKINRIKHLIAFELSD